MTDRRHLAVALALAVCGNIAAAAAPDMSVFGLTIGQPLQLPECESIKGISTPGMYSDFQARTCKKAVNLIRELKPHEIIFGYSYKIPTWVRGRSIWVYESGDKLISVMVQTNGLAEQEAVLASLTEKYGVPTETANVAKQNGMGARFESHQASWKLDGLEVVFDGVADRVDRGAISVQTPDANNIIKQEAVPEPRF